MSQEIERKFILSKIPKNLPALKIKQGYLQLDKNCTIRVRSTSSSAGSKNTLTIKGPTSLNGMSRYEFETKFDVRFGKNISIFFQSVLEGVHDVE